MKLFKYSQLSKEKISRLISRNVLHDAKVNDAVSLIISKVRREGDQALLHYASLFDKIALKRLTVRKADLRRLAARVTSSEGDAIRKAASNIRRFHEAQLAKEKRVETVKGVVCWREFRPIQKVGLYVPGGSAVLPSTFLMLVIPAQIAGCKEIVVCSPPAANGLVNSYLAYCAQLLGIEKIYLAGGAQAVAAMAYGTRTIPRVEKIFGPGNRYVTHAKNMVNFLGAAAIDFPAGPSEVMVIADETADPVIVAGDLLSAAEHGPDSQVVLLSPSRTFIEKVLLEVRSSVKTLKRKAITLKALSKSFALWVDSLDEAIDFSNRYAPEHVIVSCKNYKRYIPMIQNAGSVFLGHYSPESAGDYASGTNHTLPTSGFARSYSGLSVDAFVKKISFQELTAQGVSNLGKTIETFADIEELEGHGRAVTLRLNALKQKTRSRG